MADFVGQDIKHPDRPRYKLTGHGMYCSGHMKLGIRHEDGKYRIFRACTCGASRQDGLHLFNTHAEAWAVFKLITE